MFLLLCLLFLLCGLVVYYATRNQNYWQSRNVPSLPPKWLFGNYKDILFAKRHMGLAFQDMYNAFPEARYVGYLRMRQPCVLLRHPDVIRSVLATNFSSFSANDVQVDRAVDPLFGNNPFVLRGEEWKRTRGHFVPTMTPARLRGYLPAAVRVSAALVRHLHAEFARADSSSAAVETKQLCTKYTTDVVTNAVFGVENDSFEDPHNTLLHITSNLFSSTFADHVKVMVVLFFPQLASLLKIRLVKKECEQAMLSLTRQVIRQRLDTGEIRNDFFQLMINYKQNDTHNVFTDEYIASHCFNVVADGTETSSDALCFTLFELAWHEDVQDRLRRDIHKSLRHTAGEITFEALSELQYLDMVIMESLRMHPPAMALTRVCTARKALGSDAPLEPGTPVTVSIYGLHMDPALYTDPLRFLPERFHPDTHALRDKFTYLPFGEGPRICLGMKFALLQMKVALVAVLREFRVRPSPRTPHPPPIDPNVFLKRPLHGAWVCLQPAPATFE